MDPDVWDTPVIRMFSFTMIIALVAHGFCGSNVLNLIMASLKYSHRSSD